MRVLKDESFYLFKIQSIVNSELKPCNGVVDCYVDRPHAKTAVIVVMFGFSLFTILVS